MSRLAVGVLGLLALLTGCQYFEDVNLKAYREFHAACWAATVDAYASQQAEVILPSNPPAPRMCEGRIVSAYHGIAAAAQAERDSWRHLRSQSQTSLQFVAEMLEVLSSRDTLNIEHLAPQIETFAEQHQKERENWRNSRNGISVAVIELESAWSELWPQQDLSFNLTADAQARYNVLYPPPGAVRTEALTQYYSNEYARLAMIYLDFEPAQPPNPKSHVPDGCDELSWALKRLEAALLVRYSMDQAIEADVKRIQELAMVDLSQTPWDEISIPQGRYARPRVAASIARLKLLKHLDALLMNCLDVIVRDVDLHWRKVWPQNQLETNIFAYAGLSHQVELPQNSLTDLPEDPLADLTFRR